MSPPESPFADELARRYVAELGYRPGVPLALAELGQHCDTVLHYFDDIGVSLVCIVDAQHDAQRSFSMSGRRLAELGDAFAAQISRDAGQAEEGHHRGLSVSFRIVEVRSSKPGASERQRLRELVGQVPRSSRTALLAFALDPATATVVSSESFDGWFRGRRDLVRWMRAPKLTVDELQAAVTPGARRSAAPPTATYAILALVAMVFGLEMLVSPRPWTDMLGPQIQVLVVMGAMSKGIVLEFGEWWRLMTAALLHGNLVHLAFNGFVLWMAGRVVEDFVGPRWLAAIFVLCGVGGSLAGFVNAGHIVSVGASGAIMGLLAVAICLARRVPPGAARSRLRGAMLQVLVPSLLPLVARESTMQIDYAAHLGGAMTGFVLGWLLLRAWPLDRAEPPGRALASAIVAAGLLAVVAAVPTILGHLR